MSKHYYLTLPALLVLVVSSAFAEDPPPDRDPLSEINGWISQLMDTDATKVTLSAGALIDKSREKDLAPDIRQKIRLAIKAHLDQEKTAIQNVSVILRVISQKKEKFFNKDIVTLACKAPAGLFELAIETLGVVGDESAQDEFTAIFSNASNPLQTRVVAIRALNHLKSWKSIPALIAARADPMPEIAAAAQYCLEGILGFPFALDSAGWAKWWDENSSKPRENILHDAIDRLRSTGLSLSNPSDLVQNVKMLKTGIRLYQERALENLSTLADPSSIPDLLAYVRTAPGVNLRERTIRLLGDLANKEGAVKGKLNAEIARELVTILPRESDGKILTAIIEVLGKVRRIDGMDLVAPLIPFLDHANAAVQLHAARSIGTIGGDEARAAVPGLCALLVKAGSDSGPRREAAIALGIIRDPAAAPALVQALTDPDANVRFNSANSIGLIKDESAFEALIKALSIEQEDRVLEVEIKALRGLGNSAAMTPLARLSSRKPALSDKVLDAVAALCLEDAELLWTGADAFAAEARHDLGLKLVASAMSRNPTPAHKRRHASYFGDAGRWDDAAREFLALLKAEPEDKDLFDRLLRALCQIDEPKARGFRTAESLSSFPAKAAIFWECLVRDWAAKLSQNPEPLFLGAAGGFEGIKNPDPVFDALVSFIVNPDAKFASAAHSMLKAWTAREIDPIAEDVAEAQRKQVSAGWKEWWSANKARFPFSPGK